MLISSHLGDWLVGTYLGCPVVVFIFPCVGFDQVVVGDLVYCKEPCTQKETSYLQCEDGSGNDTNDSINPDEISETDVPEERNTSVKVYYYTILTFCNWYSMKALLNKKLFSIA